MAGKNNNDNYIINDAIEQCFSAEDKANTNTVKNKSFSKKKTMLIHQFHMISQTCTIVRSKYSKWRI